MDFPIDDVVYNIEKMKPQRGTLGPSEVEKIFCRNFANKLYIRSSYGVRKCTLPFWTLHPLATPSPLRVLACPSMVTQYNGFYTAACFWFLFVYLELVIDVLIFLRFFINYLEKLIDFSVCIWTEIPTNSLHFLQFLSIYHMSGVHSGVHIFSPR